MFGGSIVAEKYEVHQNAPLKKKNSKTFTPEGPHENVSLDPAVALDGPIATCEWQSSEVMWTVQTM